MTKEIINNLQFSINNNEAVTLSNPLLDTFQVLSDFFENNKNNKICIVFPAKVLASQWLSIPFTMHLILQDYKAHAHHIYNSHEYYNKGDKLILNNDAIVEWSKFESDLIYFKYSPSNYVDEIGVSLKNISKLQPAPTNRKSLSSYKRVMNAVFSKSKVPLDSLLNIKTDGNKLFQKNSLCLISDYKSYDDATKDLFVNHYSLSDYFRTCKIDEFGTIAENSPLLISNNLSKLALYLTSSSSVSGIIINGFSAIQERAIDFSDIDVKNIPTILITDLSEIESFENIGKYGFEFFNITKDNLKLDPPANHSPFHLLHNKLKNYISFNIVKEICQNTELESITQKIHSIEDDESNNDLNTLKFALIQIRNLVSRVTHVPTASEISIFNSKINNIESLFSRCRMWLGDSRKPIETSISLLQSVINKLTSTPSEKCTKLKEMINEKSYDYIICPTEEEAKALNCSLNTSAEKYRPQVITVADANDNLISNRSLKAILTGWARSNNINRILSTFLFSELTLLFYNFENKYFNSLQRRNRKHSEIIKATINSIGVCTENEPTKSKGFDDLYSVDEIVETAFETSFDILDFELKLDNTQYSKYTFNGNLIDSIKAKRITFENDFFIYSSESHKFLIINEFIEKQGDKANLYRRKIEALKTGDVIAFIHTDRDILVELVVKNTHTKKLDSVKKWTELWKDLLKEYYTSIGNDFKKLVDDLRKNDCKKHEATIRAWLQDESRIGPK